MKIIMGNRQTGKTTELIKMSAETGAVIVTHLSQNKKDIFELAQKMGLEIPAPITHYQFSEKRGNYDKQSYLIDEAQYMVQNLMGSVTAITLDTTAAEVVDLNPDKKDIKAMINEFLQRVEDMQNSFNRPISDKPLFAIHHQSTPTEVKFRFVNDWSKEETPTPPAAEPVNLCSVKVSLTPMESTDGQLFVLGVSAERMGIKTEASKFVHCGEVITAEVIKRLNDEADNLRTALIQLIDAERGGHE